MPCLTLKLDFAFSLKIWSLKEKKYRWAWGIQQNRKEISEVKPKHKKDQNQMLFHDERLLKLLEGSQSTMYFCQYLCSSGQVTNIA